MLDFSQLKPQVEDMARYLAAAETPQPAPGRKKTLANLSSRPVPPSALGDDIQEIYFPAQFNLNQPPRKQALALLHRLTVRLRILNVSGLDYLILPELPAAAAALTEILAVADPEREIAIVQVKDDGTLG